jgi:hypothetical protein
MLRVLLWHFNFVLNLIAPFLSFEKRDFSELGSVAVIVFTAFGSTCDVKLQRRHGASSSTIRNAGILC